MELGLIKIEGIDKNVQIIQGKIKRLVKKTFVTSFKYINIEILSTTTFGHFRYVKFVISEFLNLSIIVEEKLIDIELAELHLVNWEL